MRICLCAPFVLTRVKGFVILTKSFVKIWITKTFCYNKIYSSVNKTFGCCSKIFGCSNKKFVCCPYFFCRNKTFFFREPTRISWGVFRVQTFSAYCVFQKNFAKLLESESPDDLNWWSRFMAI